MFQRPRCGRRNLIKVKWLRDEIVSPELNCLNGVSTVAVGGHDNYGEFLDMPFLKSLQEFVATATRHSPVTEDEVRLPLHYYWQSLSRILCLQHFEFAGLEHL